MTFIDPGDLLLAFILGPRLDRQNREKVANDPKLWHGYGERPLSVVGTGSPGPTGIPPSTQESAAGSWLRPVGRFSASANPENPNAYPGYPRDVMGELTGRQVPRPFVGGDAKGPPSDVVAGVKSPIITSPTSELAPDEAVPPSFLDQYGTPLAIGAGVAGAGVLGGAGLAWYQNRKRRQELEAAGAKEANWLHRYTGINPGGEGPHDFGQGAKDLPFTADYTEKYVRGLHEALPGEPPTSRESTLSTVVSNQPNNRAPVTITTNKNTLARFFGDPVGPATGEEPDAQFMGDVRATFPAKGQAPAQADAAAESKAPPAPGDSAGEVKEVPSWLARNQTPLILAGGGLAGLGGLAWYMSRKSEEEKRHSGSGQLGPQSAFRDRMLAGSPSADRMLGIKLAALGPLEALAAARATGYEYPTVAKALAASAYSDDKMPLRGAWARTQAGLAGGRQLAEGTKFVSKPVRWGSAALGDTGGDAADNLLEGLATFGDPRNVDKARQAYIDNDVDRYSDEVTGYDKPMDRRELVESMTRTTPRVVMNASDVVARDFDIAAHRHNRKESPGHYWLNPFVPGPFAELGARLSRRASAEKADPDNMLRSSLYLPGVPELRGLLSPGNADRRAKARGMSITANELYNEPDRKSDKDDADDKKKEASVFEFMKRADGILDTVQGWGNQANDWANGQLDRIGTRVGTAAEAGANQSLTSRVGGFFKDNPWAAGAGIGALGGAGLGLLGGMGSKRKKKDRFGDVMMGGLLGGGLGGIAGGLLGGSGTPATPDPDGSAVPAGGAAPAGPLSANLVGGTGGTPSLGGVGSFVQAQRDATGSPTQIANNLAAAGSRSGTALRNLTELTIPTVQRAEELRGLANGIGNFGADHQLTQSLERFGRLRGDAGLAGGGLAGLRRTVDAFQTGENLPPGFQRLNVAPNSDVFSASQRRPEALAGLVGAAAGTGGEVTARDARIDAHSGLAGGPLSAGYLQPRTAVQDLADKAVSPETLSSPTQQQPVELFRRLLEENEGDPQRITTGTETNVPAVSSYRSPLGRTVAEGTAIGMVGRGLIGGAIGGNPTTAAAGRLSRLLAEGEKAVTAPAGGGGVVGAAVRGAGTTARGAGMLLNQLNPLRGLRTPVEATGGLAQMANNAPLIDRLMAAANARPGVRPVTRDDVIASIRGGGGKAAPIAGDQLRVLADTVAKNPGMHVPTGVPRPALRPTVGGVASGVGGAVRRLTGSAYRAAPVGLGLGLYRNMGPKPTSSSYQTPMEDIASLLGSPWLGRPDGLDPGRPGFTREVASTLSTIPGINPLNNPANVIERGSATTPTVSSLIHGLTSPGGPQPPTGPVPLTFRDFERMLPPPPPGGVRQNAVEQYMQLVREGKIINPEARDR